VTVPDGRPPRAPGARRPAGHPPRREYLAVLLLGAAGAALVLLAVRQGWARVLTIEPRPLPATSVSVRGQDLVPAAGALGLAALAGLAAVIATRRTARRAVGGLLVLFGVGIILAVSLPVTTAQVRSAAASAAPSGAGGAASTVGSTAGSGGTGVAGLSLASHVTLGGAPWRWVVLLGGLAVLAAGLLAAWRGASWPVMSSRYDQPAGPQGAAAAPATDPAALWESLSQGIDPTEPGPAGAQSGAQPGDQARDQAGDQAGHRGQPQAAAGHQRGQQPAAPRDDRLNGGLS
jgi:uncharacterized membrane protein (TIGR02234 family)